MSFNQYESEYEGNVTRLNEFIYFVDKNDFKIPTSEGDGYFQFTMVKDRDRKVLMLAKMPDWLVIDPTDPEHRAMLNEIDPDLFERCFGED